MSKVRAQPEGVENFATLDPQKVEEQLEGMVKRGKIPRLTFDQIMQLVPTLIDLSKRYLNLLASVGADAKESEKQAFNNIEKSMASTSAQMDRLIDSLYSDEAKLEALRILNAQRADEMKRSGKIFSKSLNFKKVLLAAGIAAIGGVAALMIGN